MQGVRGPLLQAMYVSNTHSYLQTLLRSYHHGQPMPSSTSPALMRTTITGIDLAHNLA